MKRLSRDIGLIHFTGIGGAGMSGIAEIMHGMGYAIQGSDRAANAAPRLAKMGVKIFTGHDPSHLRDAKLLVFSSAIKGDNPELKYARANHIPLVRRADMLGELMRLKTGIAVAGSHGKTTTTSLLAAIFDAATLEPTVINGGLINAYGASARLGEGEWMIAEADESDGTFSRLPATIAVITNIDREHMDYYHSLPVLEEAFRHFVEHLPFYGFAAICHDRPELRALAERIEDRRLIHYGTDAECDVEGFGAELHDGGMRFGLASRLSGKRVELGMVQLAMPGIHNMLNALGAAAVALALDIPFATIASAFESFAGVKRRFSIVGQPNGITIVDDYAHHPAELAAVLETARSLLVPSKGKLIAVLQPHRYSRLQDLFDEFCTALRSADKIVLTPVYAAGETQADAPDRDSLRDALIQQGHQQVFTIDEEADLSPCIKQIARAGDMVVCMGAGSVSQWANALPAQLAATERRAS